MNTRIQVEHAVTEMVTGPRFGALANPHCAVNGSISIPGALLTPNGHAIECRGPRRGPDQNSHAVATSSSCARPRGPASATTAGPGGASTCRFLADPMISKLVAWAEDRPQASSGACAARSAVSSRASGRPCSFHVAARPGVVSSTGAIHTTYLDDPARATAVRLSTLSPTSGDRRHRRGRSRRCSRRRRRTPRRPAPPMLREPRAPEKRAPPRDSADGDIEGRGPGQADFRGPRRRRFCSHH